jgi:hypothetical protein
MQDFTLPSIRASFKNWGYCRCTPQDPQALATKTNPKKGPTDLTGHAGRGLTRTNQGWLPFLATALFWGASKRGPLGGRARPPLSHAPYRTGPSFAPLLRVPLTSLTSLSLSSFYCIGVQWLGALLLESFFLNPLCLPNKVPPAIISRWNYHFEPKFSHKVCLRGMLSTCSHSRRETKI